MFCLNNDGVFKWFEFFFFLIEGNRSYSGGKEEGNTVFINK